MGSRVRGGAGCMPTARGVDLPRARSVPARLHFVTHGAAGGVPERAYRLVLVSGQFSRQQNPRPGVAEPGAAVEGAAGEARSADPLTGPRRYPG